MPATTPQVYTNTTKGSSQPRMLPQSQHRRKSSSNRSSPRGLDSPSSSRNLMVNSAKLRKIEGSEKDSVCILQNQGIMQITAMKRKVDKISIETKATTTTKDPSHTHPRDPSTQKQNSITPCKAMSLAIAWLPRRHSR